MKATQFFVYSERARLYMTLYRDIIKAGNEKYAKDAIVRGHVQIKACYLIRQVQYEHRLACIADNYCQVSAILADLRRECSDETTDRLVLEAYGAIPEKEIMDILTAKVEEHSSRAKIDWNYVKESPRHIGNLI